MPKIKGFFESDELEEMGVGKNLIENVCDKCGLFRTCRNPKMPVSGKGKRKVLIIAQNPGKIEDEKNIQLIGEAGQLLRKKLNDRNLDLDIDFWKDNSIRCFTPDNREPTKTELKACKPNLDKTIKELQPEFIWLLGKSAVESFYMGKFSDVSIGRWRNLCIPDKSTNAYILPMYHPSFLLRNQGSDITESVFDRDLDFAIDCLKLKPYNHKPYLDYVFPLTDYNELVEMLKIILEEKPEVLTFDYETTGLKPYNKGHKIVAISACDSNDYAFSFPYQHKYHKWNDNQFKQITKLWKEVLLDKNIYKIAQNAKFEEIWSREMFKINKVENLDYCTMTTAHIIDAREKFTGLKFQTYINFGIEDYGKKLKPYLEAADSSGFNKAEEAPFNELLLYSATDSLMTKWLHEKQKEIFSKNSDLERARMFFQEGLDCFADMQQTGINTDSVYFLNTYNELGKEIDKREKELDAFKQVKQFENKYRKKINYESSHDLRKLLFDIMGIVSNKTTNKNMESVDEEVLVTINHPITKKILEKRKINKIRNTYLSQFVKEINDDSKIRPFFDLHIPRSCRSCVAKGTLIYAIKDFIKYPNGVPIEEIKEGDYVYCFDDKLNPAIRKVLWSGKTGHKKVIRIHWKGARSDYGYLDVTPDHLIRHISGKYIFAKELIQDYRRDIDNKHSSKSRVLSLKRKKDELYFTGHISNSHRGILEHRFIYEQFNNYLDYDKRIHHKDNNHLNHIPNNLQAISNAFHAKIHCKFNNPEIRKKNIEKIKELARQGLYKKIAKRGIQNPNYLNLSRLQCLKLLAKNGGEYTKKVPYDFQTFKNYLIKYEINNEIIKLRYDKNKKYISRKRLIALHNSKGIKATSKELGHNYYKLKRLYAFYGIEFKRKWKNQYGEFIPNNHTIIRIEYLDNPIDVYDIEVEDYNNFFANEICVHNSSSAPNWHNLPEHDEEAKKLVKSGIIPSKGNKLLDWDYGSIEVRMGAVYTKDPVLIDYINDPKTDMHRDTASDIFILVSKEITIEIRFVAKNDFVFPEFYGSYYRNIAKNIWKDSLHLKTNSGATIKDHLKSKGIDDYYSFENHVKCVEERFWKKFKVFRQWQENHINDFIKNGHLEMLFGFQSSGYLTRNKIINYPFQGTAFHCLLWSIIQINKELKKNNYKTRIVGQIHDCCIYDLVPEEEKDIIELSEYIATKRIREEFSWINVPLTIEWESTEIDEPWYFSKPFK